MDNQNYVENITLSMSLYVIFIKHYCTLLLYQIQECFEAISSVLPHAVDLLHDRKKRIKEAHSMLQNRNNQQVIIYIIMFIFNW